MKSKIIAVVGPTASGKSDLSVFLAHQFDGEVISADSRQIFRGLNIGTGKITEEEMEGIPHYLIDVKNPEENYSVVDYQKDAHESIKEILNKKQLPILCGGTGYYIQSVVDNPTFPNIPQNPELRKKLEEKTTEDLVSELEMHDKEYANLVDTNNRRRLIRAIEIARTVGSVQKIPKNPLYEVLQIGIETPSQELRERIRKRLTSRTEAGMIEEVRKLYDEGLSYERMEELGLEYRYLAKYLKKELSKEKMLEILLQKIWQYAKRQKTWFKKDKRIKWFLFEEKDRMVKEVKSFLS